MGIIYGLYDPRVNELVYIGKTENTVSERLRQHLKPSNLKWATHKNNWVKKLLFDGVRPQAYVLETVECSDELSQAEIFWIEYFNSLGAQLYNHTPGGDGCRRGTKFSDATRAKMSASHMGKKMPKTAEHRAKLSAANKGYVPSSEALEKMRQARAEYVAKAHATGALGSLLRSNETRQKIRQKALGRMSPLRRPVVDQNGTIYESVSAAAAAYGVSSGAVSMALKAGRPVKGHCLRFAT